MRLIRLFKEILNHSRVILLGLKFSIFTRKSLPIACYLFASSLLIPVNAIAQAEADVETPNLSVDQNKIYSISIKPNHIDGATSYKLKVFTDERESRVVASAIRPMDGKIVDVEIYDIDKDGADELVVMMAETVSTSTKMHFDVFEFDGQQLSWVEDFSPISNLFELYSKIHRQQLD